MVAILSLTWSSCSLFSDDNSQEEPVANTQESQSKEKEDEGLPHPKSPTAWNTKALLITNILPEKDKLEACRQQLYVSSKTIKGPDALIAVKKQTTLEIKQNIPTYHWCFYQIVTDLDEALTNDNMNMTFEQKNELFYKNMKALWLLARALDEVEGDETYFSYLRKRYIELSNDHFARDVDVLGTPLSDHESVTVDQKGNDSKKPAGELEIDL